MGLVSLKCIADVCMWWSEASELLLTTRKMTLAVINVGGHNWLTDGHLRLAMVRDMLSVTPLILDEAKSWGGMQGMLLNVKVILRSVVMVMVMMDLTSRGV
jgi:hypothetical protein